MTHRKIGGIHWFAIGRLRIAFCIRKPRPAKLPNVNQFNMEFIH